MGMSIEIAFSLYYKDIEYIEYIKKQNTKILNYE